MEWVLREARSRIALSEQAKKAPTSRLATKVKGLLDFLRERRKIIQGESPMIMKILGAVTVASFVTISGASWAQVGVGGNGVPNYGKVEASKNRTVTNHGAGGNATPTYPKVEASKNKKVVNHGAGGNATPTYSKTGTH
jgi:hypothetical protein